MAKSNNKQTTLFNAFLYICVLLSGLVPRYIFDFKIKAVIGISMFTIAALITWVLFVRRIKIYRHIESYFFFIWFIMIVGSVWRAQRIGVWAEYVDWIITALLFMQILYCRPDNNSFEIVIRAIVDALFIQLVIGLYEITFNRYIFEIGSVSKRLYGKVAISMFFNQNDYATFAVTILPFAIYLLIKKTGWLYKIYYSFIVAASIFLSLRSESRGAILGLILIVGTILFLWMRKSKRIKIIGFCAVLAVIGLIAISQDLQELLQNTISAILYDNSGVSNDIRTNLIKNGLYFLKSTHGLGVGAGNLYQWLLEKTIYPVEGILLIHNWYLEIAVTFGLFLFALYMIFHVKIIISLGKNFNVKKEFWTTSNTILISFIAFSLVSISSSSNVYSEWVWMYLVFISTFVMFNKKPSQISDKIGKGENNEN